MPSGVYDRSASNRKKAAMWSWSCEVCGKVRSIRMAEYRVRVANGGAPRFCSVACRNAGQVEANTKVSVKCDGCGAGFLKDRHRMRDRNYCTKACGLVAVKTAAVMPCSHCGADCERRADPARKAVYCSVGCRGLAAAMRIKAPRAKRVLEGDAKERARAYHGEYQKANRERINALAAAWGKRNRDKKNANQRVRRARYRGRLSAAEWRAICDEFGNVCLACGSDDRLEADHVIPVSMGGATDAGNIQPLCRSCNARKGATAVDFRPMFRLRARTGTPHGFAVMEFVI